MKQEQLEKNIRILYPAIDSKAYAGELKKKRTAACAAAVLVFLLLFAASAAGLLEEGELAEGGFLWRSAWEEGSRTVPLTAWIEGEKQELDVEVSPQSYTEEELDRLFMAMLPELEWVILGENASAEAIRGNLLPEDRLEGYPFMLSYESSDYGLLTDSGRVCNENVAEKGEEVSLKITAVCGDYENASYMTLHILPPETDGRSGRERKLKEKVRQADLDSREEAWLKLPDKVDGETVEWEEQKDGGAFLLLGLGAACVSLLWNLEEQKIHKQLKEREKELLREYPEFISRLTLLLGAGMTVRSAFYKLMNEGRKRKIGGDYLQQELELLCRDIDMGIYESQAYQNFGRRCGLQQYRRLAALLTQNLKIGARGLLGQLEYETHNALEEKKAIARKRGEEAGNKLLFPMTVMLLLVMVLVIVPAFGSFQF